MTLKEKIEEVKINKGMANELEKIADDYAIEFAEWLRTDWTCDERWSKITDSKELLEIFKKEKGL